MLGQIDITLVDKILAHKCTTSANLIVDVLLTIMFAMSQLIELPYDYLNSLFLSRS